MIITIPIQIVIIVITIVTIPIQIVIIVITIVVSLIRIITILLDLCKKQQKTTDSSIFSFLISESVAKTLIVRNAFLG